MSLSWPSWARYGNTILAFPRAIVPVAPDFMNCDQRYGNDLEKDDCKLAVAAMPASREGAEAEWGVNHQGAQYTLPMTLVSNKKTGGTCAVSIEAAGPLAHYDVAVHNPPFTLKASPFQLRGIAAYVVRACSSQEGDSRGRKFGKGGFATHQIKNLADHILEADNLDTYPTNSTFFTVTITNRGRSPPEPGNYDPSVAVLVAEYLAYRQRGLPHDVFMRVSRAIGDFTRRTQRMYAGGKTTPWWGTTAAMEDKMSYECDDKLVAPAEVDCAQVEWSELGPDDETVALGPSLTKVLTSNTCQLVITAAVATVVNWRQIRVAMDTLLNVCVASPIQRPTGGRAYVGPHGGVSGGIWGRQLDNATTDSWAGGLTGLNALPPGINITVSSTTPT